jgi:hypothetical protein
MNGSIVGADNAKLVNAEEGEEASLALGRERCAANRLGNGSAFHHGGSFRLAMALARSR